MPTVRLLKVTHNEMEFYEEPDWSGSSTLQGRWTRSRWRTLAEWLVTRAQTG